MSDEVKNKINPNTADRESLAQLPGIGETMAQRIIEKRPFAYLEDLRQVSGVGEMALERLEAYIDLPHAPPEEHTEPGDHQPAAENAGNKSSSSDLEEVDVTAQAEPTESVPAVSVEPEGLESAAEEEAPLLEFQEPEEELSASLPAVVPPQEDTFEEVAGSESIIQEPEVASPAPEQVSAAQPAPASKTETAEKGQAPLSPQKNYLTRGQAMWLGLGGFLLALILSLALSLGILASLNRGQLLFATPAEVSRLSSQIDGLNSRAQILEQDMNGLRTRIDNLETLGKRVGDLEQNSQNMQASLDEANQQIGGLSTQVTDLGTQVKNLDTQVNTLTQDSQRYQNLFTGLRDLLTRLFPATK